MQALFNSLVLGDTLGLSGANQKQIMHSTNTLEHSLVFLKCMLNEHVSINLASLDKKIEPSLVLRIGEIVRVSGIRPHVLNGTISVVIVWEEWALTYRVPSGSTQNPRPIQSISPLRSLRVSSAQISKNVEYSSDVSVNLPALIYAALGLAH